MKKFINSIYKNTNFIYKTIIFLSALLSIVYFFPFEGKFQYEFNENKFWQYDDLYAPFDFTVEKSTEEIQHEKDSLKKNIPVYLNKNNLDIGALIEKINRQIEENNSNLSKQQLSSLLKKNKKILRYIYKKGYLKKIPDSLDYVDKLIINEGKNFIQKERNKIITQDNLDKNIENIVADKDILKSLMSFYHNYDVLPDNLSIDYNKRNLNIKASIQNIDKKKKDIQKGDLLISKGEKITPDTYQLLSSLKENFSLQRNKQRNKLWVFIGYSLLVAIVLLMLFMFLKKYRPEIYENNVKISLILFNMLLLIILTTLTVKYNTRYIFLVPLAILPLILKAFFDARVGLFVHVLTILLLGFVVPNSFEFIFLQIMAGIVTILTVSELTKRSNLFSSVGNIILIYIIGYFAFHLIHEGNVEKISLEIFGLFLLNGILTIALSHQLILIYEKIFGLVSDVSLLELSNTNSKLLKRLADKAPGTFNHSLQVANLAEAAANEVNANALLVRAGALYHDIGKMMNPFYFTENQISGVNRHDDLEPEESAKIIINHVLDGIEIARKNNIPDRIIDFIRTHHGKGLVWYFYKKALEKDPDVDKEKFRYPGPNPFSKETAVLMMADAVEAASKSLREPTAEKIDNFVDKIIDGQLHSGLLDNANITMKEVSAIKKLFKKKLKNIYHLRVEYPE